MNRRSIWLLLALGLLAVGAGAMLARLLGENFALQAGTWLPRPRALADFHLQDAEGNAFAPDRLQGHPTLLFFGFTNCPDVCPTTLAMLAQPEIRQALPAAQVLFVSIDPERDTGPALQSYLSAFGSHFIGVRGDREALAPLLRSLNAIAIRQDLPGGGYTMDHSATLYLLDTRGRLVAVFTPPFSTPAIAADLRRADQAGRL